jgi:uncharacterized protein YecE (DUF72 family)
VLHRVRDVDRLAVDARVVQRAVEQPPRRADERSPCEVLAVARLLADEHDVGVPVALAEHRLRAELVQVAGRATGGSRAQRVEGRRRRDERRGAHLVSDTRAAAGYAGRMTVWLGTSGWQYADWRGPVYPPRLPQARWLEHYATLFDTVEVNNAFYRLPSAETFAQWARRTPDGFVVTVKASRYLTHVRRLKDPYEPVELFVGRARHLGRKLGPVLVQLPPRFRAAPDRLDATLAAFGRHRLRVAVEVRDASWWSDEVREVLTRHDAPLVWADRGSRPVSPLWRTASWGYVRFHEGAAAHRPCYGRTALDTWAQRIANAYRDGADVFVYFNNDPHGCAVHDAALFARACGRAGLTVTHAPDPRAHQPAGVPA